MSEEPDAPSSPASIAQMTAMSLYVGHYLQLPMAELAAELLLDSEGWTGGDRIAILQLAEAVTSLDRDPLYSLIDLAEMDEAIRGRMELDAVSIIHR